MSVRTELLLAAALSCAASVAAVPARADVRVTLTMVGGSLSIAQPSATATIAGVASSTSGTVSTGSVGSTTVNDTRNSTAGWTVSISSTDLSDGASHTITAGNLVAYLTSVPTPTVAGTAVVTTTKLSAVTGLVLSNSPGVLMTATTTLSNTVTYNPTLQLTVASTVIAGTYTGTITQSVV
jgi:hypothetical protein